jgi:GH24 family phage-related lysozyme (muramidase)/murein DD-endopeptidase MepM/ murein hydrolase activator NlpD
MARRIVSVTPASPSPVTVQADVITPNTQLAEQVYQRTAETRMAAEQTKLQAVQAKSELANIEGQVAANRPQSTSMADLFNGLGEAVKNYLAVEQHRTEQQDAANQIVKDQNETVAVRYAQEQVQRARQFVIESGNVNGIYSTQSQINDWLSTADVDEEVKQEIARFMGNELGNIQDNQLREQERARREAREALVETAVQSFTLNNQAQISTLAATINPAFRNEQINLLMRQAQPIFDAAAPTDERQLPQFFDLKNRIFNIIVGASASSADLIAGRASIIEQQNRAQATITDINNRLNNGEITFAQAEIEKAQALTAATGNLTFGDTSQAEEIAEQIKLMENTNALQALIIERDRPEAQPLVAVQIADLVYNHLLGSPNGSIELMKEANPEGYEILSNAVSVVQPLLNRRTTIIGELSTYQGRLSAAQASINELRSKGQFVGQDGRVIQFDPNNPEWLRAYASARMSDTTLPANPGTLIEQINGAQSQYNQILAQQNALRTELANGQAILSQYGLQEGLEGFTRVTQSAEWQERRSQAAIMSAEAAAAQEQRGSERTGNFPTEPAGALSRVGAATNRATRSAANSAGTFAPFPSSVPSNEIYVTAHIKSGSHADGNAIDYAPSRDWIRQNGMPPIAALSGGTVTRVVRGVGEGVAGSYGNLVEIRTQSGHRVLYSHLSTVEVNEGDVVGQGATIGVMGNTGASDGAHLHMEVWDANGRPAEIISYISSIQPERGGVNARQPLPGLGLPPTQVVRRDSSSIYAEAFGLPETAFTMPGGGVIQDGVLYGNTDMRSISNNRANTQSGQTPLEEVVNVSNPIRGVFASTDKSDYETPNDVSANYGYAFLEGQNGARNALNQVATTLNLPTQMLADVIAQTTGNTWRPRTFGSTAPVTTTSTDTSPRGNRGGRPVSAYTMADIAPVVSRLVQNEEGFRETPYWDNAQWTWGYGTKAPGPNGRITREQAMADMTNYLAADLERIKQVVRVPLTPEQVSVLLSFTYNVGNGWLEGSDTLDALNSGNAQAFTQQLQRWHNAGGRPNVLTARRRRETELFLGGTTGVDPVRTTTTTTPSEPTAAGIIPIPAPWLRQRGLTVRQAASMNTTDAIRLAGEYLQSTGRVRDLPTLWGVTWMGQTAGAAPVRTWNQRARQAFARLGQHVGRVYETARGVLGPGAVHTSFTDGCPTCNALRQSGNAIVGNRIPPHVYSP